MTQCEFHTWEIKDDQLECTDCPATRGFEHPDDYELGSTGGLPELEEHQPRASEEERETRKATTFL